MIQKASPDSAHRKVAIMHDWLLEYAGGEHVLEQLLEIYPDADIYTLCDFIPEEKRSFLQNKSTTTSFMQKLPLARTRFRHYLPLMPFAVEQFDLSRYDVVISSSCSVARAVLTHDDQVSIAYFNNTMNFAWNLYHQYLRGVGMHRGLRGLVAKAIMHYVRMWDASTANRGDHYIANSKHMSRRLARLYRRDSTVIYPPVEVNAFDLSYTKDDYYVAVTRLIPVKCNDLLVKTFNEMPDKKLIIIGDGPQMTKLKKAAGRNIGFVGVKDRREINNYLKHARALIVPSLESFGIVSVEAQACGTPVIAYGQGGSLETVIKGRTGIFFDRQDSECLIEAVEQFEKVKNYFDPGEIRENSRRFSKERFQAEFKAFVEEAVRKHHARTERAAQPGDLAGKPVYIEDFAIQESPEPVISD
jgi:glycosyltransferase involved in cell wall biosynthesis